MEDECTMCGSDVEVVDFGIYKGFKWFHTRCIICGYEESSEPDYDSMPGGYDDY